MRNNVSNKRNTSICKKVSKNKNEPHTFGQTKIIAFGNFFCNIEKRSFHMPCTFYKNNIF